MPSSSTPVVRRRAALHRSCALAWLGGRRILALWLLLGGAVAMFGCSGSPDSEGDEATSSQTSVTAGPSLPPEDRHVVPAAVAQLPNYESLDPQDDPRNLSDVDLNDGPGTRELGASKLLREVGVIVLLDSYIINIPPSAEFIAGWETNKASVSNFYHYADADVGTRLVGDFETRVLQSAESAMESLLNTDGTAVLHDAFFQVLEACGRASAWPDVELFEMHLRRGYDIMSHLIEPTFGLTYFEYQQLRHQCARYAATYPTLDPAVRDELLAPQRAHYAGVVLDRLDNELPVVEVPPEYQAEIEDLRANGW